MIIGSFVGFMIVFCYIVYTFFILFFSVSLDGSEFSFAKTGVFGDSFGAFSALMAGLAATFSYSAYLTTLRENKRLRDREEARDNSEFRRDIELTFFRLCELRIQILASIRHPNWDRSRNEFRGIDAVEQIVNTMIMVIYRADPNQEATKSRAELFADSYYLYKNDISHYLRITYHIIKFIDENISLKDEAYKYIRLLRAQLSHSEQILISLVCLYGQNQERLRNFVEKYAILNNIDDQDRQNLELEQFFAHGAFDYPAQFGTG